MKIKNEVGSIFYRVEYQGRLTRHEIHSYKNKKPVYKLTILTSMKDEIYKFIESSDWHGSSNYDLDFVIENERGEYFDNLDAAKLKSLDRFESEVNPNGDYKVARYFDDVFEGYVTDVLSKRDARNKAAEMNEVPRHYVSFQARPVK